MQGGFHHHCNLHNKILHPRGHSGCMSWPPWPLNTHPNAPAQMLYLCQLVSFLFLQLPAAPYFTQASLCPVMDSTVQTCTSLLPCTQTDSQESGALNSNPGSNMNQAHTCTISMPVFCKSWPRLPIYTVAWPCPATLATLDFTNNLYTNIKQYYNST